MDSNILSGVAVGVSLVSVVIGYINHTRIRSMCCGRKLEVSLDISKTSPDLKIKVPESTDAVQ